MEVSNLRVEPSSMVTNSKLKTSDSGSGPSSTMDSFQDGGQQNILDRSAGEFSSTQGMDSSHLNSDINNFNAGSGEPGATGQTYSKVSNDHATDGQMSGFNNTGFGRASFAMNEQHGGIPNSGSGDFSQSNNQIMPYGPTNLRPGYSTSVRPPMTNRPVMSSGSMGIVPPNYGQPRFPMSGPNIQQPVGPTPTLNQLLQSNQSQRYPSYGECNVSQSKMQTHDAGTNENFSPPQGWSGQHRPGTVPYPSSGQSNPPFRSQVCFKSLLTFLLFIVTLLLLL